MVQDSTTDSTTDRMISLLNMSGDKVIDILLSNFNYDFLVMQFYDKPIALMRLDKSIIYNDKMSDEENKETLKTFVTSIRPNEYNVSYMELRSVTNLDDDDYQVFSINESEEITLNVRADGQDNVLYYINFTYLENFIQAINFNFGDYNYYARVMNMTNIRKIIYPVNDKLFALPDNHSFNGVKKLDLSKLIKLEYVSYGFMEKCSNIEEIIFPTSIVKFEFFSLKDCPRLKTINIDQLVNLKSFSDYFLYNCPEIKTINMENLVNIERLGYNFLSGTNITKLDISKLDKLTEIPMNFANDCRNLKEIYLPNSIQKIRDNFLEKSSNITTTNFDKLSNIIELGKNIMFCEQFRIRGIIKSWYDLFFY